MAEERNEQQPQQLALFENEADAIKNKIPQIHFYMDYLIDPVAAAAKWNNKGDEHFQRKAREKFLSYRQRMEEILKESGIEAAEIIDLIELEREGNAEKGAAFRAAMELFAKKEKEIRFNMFAESAYWNALSILAEEPGVYQDPGATPTEHYLPIKEQAIMYYFAAHSEIDIEKAIRLTPEQEEELKAIYHKLDAFYLEKTGGEPYQPGEDTAIIMAFVDRENPTPETMESMAAKMLLIKGLKPTSHTMPNDAFSNMLFNPNKAPIDGKPFDLVVANATKRRKEITVYAMAEFDNTQTDIQITDTHLTEFERQISDSIITLYLAAKKENKPTIVTTEAIFKAMPGGSDNPTPQQKGAITKVIEKFRQLKVYLNATTWLRKKGAIPNNMEFVIDDYYLSTRRTKVRVQNGKTVYGYTMHAEPPILTYSRMTNQLLTIPAKYITIKKVKKKNGTKYISEELLLMTAQRQAMAGYIVRRIKIMERNAKEKRGKNNEESTQSNVILFSTLFNDVGITEQTKQSAAKKRDFVYQVLDYEELVGFIKGYEILKKGQTITGVKILF